jgi:hypothetical protein
MMICELAQNSNEMKDEKCLSPGESKQPISVKEDKEVDKKLTMVMFWCGHIVNAATRP